MTKVPTYWFIPFFFLALATSCKKPTIVNGIVTDRKTGKPINEAGIDIELKKTGDDNLNYIHDLINTDSTGKFTYENETKFGIWLVSKSGYVPKGRGSFTADINQGQSNNVSISLIPLDGHLNLNIMNNTDHTDSIYLYLYSPSIFTESNITDGLVNIHRNSPKILSGEKQIYNVMIPSEEYAHFFWGFAPVSDFVFAPFHDSIYINKDDTTKYILSF